MVLVILRTAVLGLAGNARRSLDLILPTSYRGRQEENAENRKYFVRRGVSVRNLIRTRFNFPILTSAFKIILRASSLVVLPRGVTGEGKGEKKGAIGFAADKVTTVSPTRRTFAINVEPHR